MFEEVLELIETRLEPPPPGSSGAERLAVVGDAVRAVSLQLPSFQQRRLRSAWVAWGGGGGGDHRDDATVSGGTAWGVPAVDPPHRRSAGVKRRRRLCLEAWRAFRPACNLDNADEAASADSVVFLDAVGGAPLQVQQQSKAACDITLVP